MENNYQLLDQFVGMKSQVSLHILIGDIVISTYDHQLFYYELDESNIYLKDSMNDENGVLTELGSIVEVKNLCSDLYSDVVDLVTNQFIISVTTLEERPQHLKCYRCGNDIYVPEDDWHIHGTDGWLNLYDGDVRVISGLSFCSECISGFIGEIDSLMN